MLADQMSAEDHTVSAIHGDQLPDERKRIMSVSSSGGGGGGGGGGV